jgi:hypothetical protein
MLIQWKTLVPNFTSVKHMLLVVHDENFGIYYEVRNPNQEY